MNLFDEILPWRGFKRNEIRLRRKCTEASAFWGEYKGGKQGEERAAGQQLQTTNFAYLTRICNKIRPNFNVAGAEKKEGWMCRSLSAQIVCQKHPRVADCTLSETL